jgi:hypothetical protein
LLVFALSIPFLAEETAARTGRWPELAWNARSMVAALFAYGSAAGLMDVAMNTAGVAVETAYGRPTI